MRYLVLVFMMYVVGCATTELAEAPEQENPLSVEMVFIPGSEHHSGLAAAHSAVSMNMSRGFMNEKNLYRMMGHAAIGEDFPVRLAEAPDDYLFHVKLVDGDNEGLQLRVYKDDSSQRIEVKRDETTEVEVDGKTYSFWFPRSYVASDAGYSNTPKATITITRTHPE